MEKIPKQMSAAVYQGVRDVRLEIVPVPRIGPQEILVRVAVCGVCPTARLPGADMLSTCV